MVDVRDDVGDSRDLPFDRTRTMRRISSDRDAVLPLRMPRDSVAHFPGEIQPLTVVLQYVDDAEALFVMLEPAWHERLQDALARVSEWRVAEIVAERDRFCQFFVELQHLRDASGDLRDFERMGESRTVVVPLGREEHLGLVLQAAERFRMDDSIAITLERRADVILSFRPQPSSRP